jgi:hypothetical protein
VSLKNLTVPVTVFDIVLTCINDITCVGYCYEIQVLLMDCRTKTNKKHRK